VIEIRSLTFKVLILMVFLAAFCAEAKAAEDNRVRIGITVYPDSGKGMSEQDAQLITNMLTHELVGNKNIRVFERWQLDAALRELGLGSDVNMDERTIMEAGKIVGLQYVLIGSLDFLGRKESRNDLIIIRGDVATVEEKYAVSIRMLDVTTGEVRLSFAEDGNAREVFTNLQSASSRETGSLKAQAIRDAMSRLTRRVSDTLTREY